MIGGSTQEELIWEAQDMMQRANQMLAWLVRRAGGNPEEIGALPADDDTREHREAA